MKENIANIDRDVVDPKKTVGSEIGQCRGTIMSVGEKNIKALVYPNIPACQSCLLSDNCSKSLDKRKPTKA